MEFFFIERDSRACVQIKNKKRCKKPFNLDVTKMESEPAYISLTPRAFTFQQEQSFDKQKQTAILLNLKYKGLYESQDQGKNFYPLPLTRKRHVSFDQEAQREVISIGSKHQFFVHKHEILYRTARGKTIKLQHNLSKNTYFTAIAWDGKYIYIGTSVNGVYYGRFTSSKRYINFHFLSQGLPYIPHNARVNFYEEISSIYVTKERDVYVGTNFGGGLLVKPHNKMKFHKIPLPFIDNTLYHIYHITTTLDGKIIWLSTSQGLIVLKRDGSPSSLKKVEWLRKSVLQNYIAPKSLLLVINKKNSGLYGWFRFPLSRYHLDANYKKRQKTIKAKKLFYVSPSHWRLHQKQIKTLLKKSVFNGIVLDVKDDFGYIRYQTKLPFIKKIGALRPLYRLPPIISFMRKHNKYLVVRLVVFKDPVLFQYKDYAILDKKTKKKWIGNPNERWVDPYNLDVANNYYVPLIQELTQMGIDEIQLDYIRLPSDGSIWNTFYLHKKNRNIYPSEAMESFLYTVRKATDIPISLDIYGYNGIYRAPGLIGQDVDAYAQHADIIAPMLYSSHFGNLYLTDAMKANRISQLMDHCAKRYQYIAHNQFLVRPWLQGFPMKVAIWGYGKDYIRKQVRSVKKHGSEGFMFWGSFQNAKKVAQALSTEK